MKKSKSITRIFTVFLILALASTFTGCYGTTREKTTAQNTMVSGGGNSADSFDKADINPSDYVDLGAYEGIEIKVDGLDVYVGEVPVSVPYRDEGSSTEWTLRYYYSQVDPTEDAMNWVIPADEDVARLDIPGIMTFLDLKDYVCQKLNENDEIASFMLIGDAVMEQIVANSSFEKIPEDVMLACEGIYTDYLENMLARCNEIGEIPSVQKDENSAYKVLTAMAIAKEAGIIMDTFDYEEVLKYLVE